MPNPSHHTTTTSPPTDQILPDTRGTRWGPLSTTERHIVYSYVNAWIQHHGLDAFCTKVWKEDEFVFLTKTMNEVNTSSALRGVGNVKREVRRLYEGRLSPLGKLWKRSEGVKVGVEMGRVIGEEERYPGMAICVPVVEGGGGVEGSVEEGTKQSVPGIAADGESSGLLPAKSDKLVGERAVGLTRFNGRQASLSVSQSGAGLLKPTKSSTVKGQKQGFERIAEPKALPAPAALQQKELIVKLPVDWSRLHVRQSGHMAVLSDGEIWESSSE